MISELWVGRQRFIKIGETYATHLKKTLNYEENWIWIGIRNVGQKCHQKFGNHNWIAPKSKS